VVNTISALRDDPRPAKATRLTNREEYRIRQGGYRILYTIEDTVKVVEVRKVAHRRNVYRG
jgi:mRNA interferase RelE/StbE